MPRHPKNNGWGSPLPPPRSTPRSWSCDRCKLIDCHSMHDYTASKCPLQVCDICPELADLDAEITGLQDRLINLVRKRWTVKSKVNTRHDQILSHLPIEIVTDIFLLVADTLRDYSLSKWDRPAGYFHCPPLFLGAVCKRWRDITLGLPLLWTSLTINSWSHTAHLNLMEEWLRRSTTAPLSVGYHGEHLWGSGSKPRSTPRPIKLLRQHASRWNRITFSGPWKLFHDLMHNSEITAPVDILDIHIFIENTAQLEPVHLPEPLCPKVLTICAAPINKIPLEWSNLTRLNATSMHIDEVLHILNHGNNLVDCIIKDVVESKGIYPLPNPPIVHRSMRILNLGSADLENSDVLLYLTLPSLEILDYEARHDLMLPDTLVAFLERSRAPLHTFRFKYTLGSLDVPWYECLPAITHLELGIYGYNDALHASEVFLEALARTSAPLTLPHLRELRMYMHSIPKSFWSMLRDICHDSQGGSGASRSCDSDSSDTACAISQDEKSPETYSRQLPVDRRRRPLESVYIQHLAQHWREMTEDDVIQQMLDTKSSGIRRLEVKDNHGNDLIASAINVSTSRHLPFSSKRLRRNSTWDEWPSDSDS